MPGAPGGMPDMSGAGAGAPSTPVDDLDWTHNSLVT
jgi:hypothetical protein